MVIVKNIKDNVVVLKKNGLPSLRIFPSLNQIDNDILKDMLTCEINRALFNTHCIFVEKPNLTPKQKREAKTAFTKNHSMNEAVHPARMVKVQTPLDIEKENIRLKSKMQDMLTAMQDKEKKLQDTLSVFNEKNLETEKQLQEMKEQIALLTEGKNAAPMPAKNVGVKKKA